MSDDDVLRHYWHPVATADEVGEGPVATQLLAERLVLWRSQGRVAAFRDLCIHRGSALSLGRVDGDRLVCGYHGWEYGADGACTRIPALERTRTIPSKARATAYRAVERYGLIWVCLGEPRTPIPELPELEDPAYRTFFFGAETWETSAARMIENFVDSSHFPFVHPGLNGTPDDPRLPDFPVYRQDGELRFEVRFVGPASAEFQGPSRLSSYTNFTGGRRQYRVVMPFTAQSVRPTEDGTRLVISAIASPISAGSMRRYAFSSRNFALDQPDNDFRRLQRIIVDQDRAIVESQRPEELPVDLTEELHLKGPDAGTLEYRRMLGELGVK